MQHDAMTPTIPVGYRRNLRREWLALSLLILMLVTWLTLTGGLRRMDHLVQDTGLRLSERAAHPDIAIIAIDDRSIESIGRWPWRRALHAQLVDQVTAQSPRAIGLDVLFGEEDADYPGDDRLLARALERNGHAVLPVARRGEGTRSSADAPLPLLLNAAAQLGHVLMHLDEDGVARGLFALEGPQTAPWPHFSTAMLCAEEPALASCRGNAAPTNEPWASQNLQVLRFAQGQPAFTTYSYIDVLKGRLPADALRGKYVIVGATATGLGDMFAAPMIRQAERIPGVEIIAHALNARLMGWHIERPPEAWNLAFNLIPVALALLCLVLLGPLAGLISSATLFVITLIASASAPAMVGWQFAAAPALVGIACGYPLWSWRRLSAAAHFLQLEMRALQGTGLAPLPDEQKHAVLRGDLLEQRIHAVENATQRLRKLHQFVSDSLQHLPSPTFVCDAQGRVTLANDAALHYLQVAHAPQGQAIAQVLAGLVQASTGKRLLPQDASHLAELPPQQEGCDAQGRHMLMLCKPFALDGSTIWLIILVDLTDMRRAQQQRDQALHFISHDLRAPAASILTLLEMRREFPEQLSQQDLLTRIERHARSLLSMAQGFVQLAGAQTQEYESTTFNLATALEEAVDDAWASARDRQVQVRITQLPNSAPIQGDQPLIRRAIMNILDNAIKFSPAGGTVQCALTPDAPYWVIAVRDQGPGIAPEQQGHLFQPFKRLHAGNQPGKAGVGLGLALVETVAQRHGGQIQVTSSPGVGAEFRLLLPQQKSGL